jgi:hypothetical protein
VGRRGGRSGPAAAREEALSGALPRIEARRAGPLAAGALARALGGRVAAVQSRAVLLLLDNGGLVALLPAGAPLHPWAVSAALDATPIAEGTTVRVAAGVVAVGALRLPLSDFSVVDLRLPHHPGKLPVAPRMRLQVAAADAGDAALDEALLKNLSRFAAGGPVGDLAGLVGRGPGLTPSGDDVIVGVLVALDLVREAVPGTAEVRQTLARVLAGGLTSRTTRLSAQLLSAAAEGLYAEPVLALVEALVDGAAPPGRLDGAVRGLLAVGHDSGAAMLRGISAGLTRAAGD